MGRAARSALGIAALPGRRAQGNRRAVGTPGVHIAQGDGRDGLTGDDGRAPRPGARDRDPAEAPARHYASAGRLAILDIELTGLSIPVAVFTLTRVTPSERTEVFVQSLFDTAAPG